MAGYESLREKVFTEVIVPDCEQEVRDVIKWRHRWRKIANWAEGVGHLFLIADVILALSAGYFDEEYLSYIAGCSSALCLALLRFAAYANKESSERNEVLNRYMNLLGLGAQPDLVAGSAPDAGDTRDVEAPPDGSPGPLRPPSRKKKKRADPRRGEPADDQPEVV
jgi:hypothetical protein